MQYLTLGKSFYEIDQWKSKIYQIFTNNILKADKYPKVNFYNQNYQQ